MSALGDHDRQLSNVILVGTVAEIDEAKALARVNADGMVTAWIPWSANRAGPGVREWSAPEPGEQVVIACPYGDPSQGVIIGSVYQDAHDQPASDKRKHRVEYADGAFVEYDRAAKAMQTDVPVGGKIKHRVGASFVEITDGKITLSSNGSTLEIDAAGIRLNGARIDLN